MALGWRALAAPPFGPLKTAGLLLASPAGSAPRNHTRRRQPISKPVSMADALCRLHESQTFGASPSLLTNLDFLGDASLAYCATRPRREFVIKGGWVIFVFENNSPLSI